MKCGLCNTKYPSYGMVEDSMVYFCSVCYITTWLKFPKYLPKEQRDKYGDELFAKDHFPQHLIEDI